MAICYLVGAAPDAQTFEPQPGDLVLAADGGYAHLRAMGVTPDLVLGDFDSLEGEVPRHIPAQFFAKDKDASDLALALEEGLRRNYRCFTLIGAGGGRPDHAFANLQLLVKAARCGAFAVLRDGDFSVTALSEQGSLCLSGSGLVSVFAYGGTARGVCLRGMEYPLENAALSDDTPRGLSNRLLGAQAEIAMESGTLLVFWETEKAEALANI
ncbi:MAG: thiamine diphosphokinase [Oscillospiraceae bacterium]|jgi:thiamine pyrophosphokinase|nr:thiamine diphosphokinase [Oscillospiraceae bacterium]